MKRYIYMVGGCVAVIAIFRPALAAQPKKKDTVRPAVTSSPTPSATTSSNFHMPPAALAREMQELERAKHLLDMSAQNDHSSHEAMAARHLQTAINELKLETKANAKTEHAGQPTKATAAPGARKK